MLRWHNTEATGFFLYGVRDTDRLSVRAPLHYQRLSQRCMFPPYLAQPGCKGIIVMFMPYLLSQSVQMT